ncbi:MAG: UvrD-helicase domain-containing protein [Candidatus Obscuribacterales bacterium]|nr:UvrD-helicase domain-containing protein [Candidatus Obscuribacterales bacterium]
MPLLTEEQNLAINSIDRHVLVSAGAGSGKTFVLVERYIKVLETDRQAGINDIIAVTFTRKAAEEMRSRLKLRLKELAEETEGEMQERWLDCLSEVEAARIGTIHSLCESILKNFPSEAGIDPQFEILDDLERAELLADSIDESLHFVIERPLQDFQELLDHPIESVRTWISGFLRSPLKYKESRKPFSDCSLDSMKKFAESFVNADIERTLTELMQNKLFQFELNYLRDCNWVDKESKIGLLYAELESYLSLIVDPELGREQRWQALCSLAHMPPFRTIGGPQAKDLRDSMSRVKKLMSTLSKKHLSELNDSDLQSFKVMRALLLLSNDALERYENLKRQHQKLDFDDLISRCQLLLSNGVAAFSVAKNENARDYAGIKAVNDLSGTEVGHAVKQLSRNLRAILVDEFQDTNWTQAKLLTALATAGGRLFLIGDDKQSIYKFQGADVGTFNACKNYISSMSDDMPSIHASTADQLGLPVLRGSGQRMSLSQSFRSHPEIVNFVNHLFRTLFDADSPFDGKDSACPESETAIKGTSIEMAYKSTFQALSPARERGALESSRIDIIYTPAPDPEQAESSGETERLEAALTAQWIQEKVEEQATVFDKALKTERPLKYSDFAILLQANSDFAIIERALADAAIPYVSIAGSGFLDRQEVYDLENLLKWLICPQDSHALFAVLRSPLFGVSDDILHELKAGKSNSLWQCLSQKANEAEQDELQAVRKNLQDLQRASGKLSLPEILRKAIMLTAYDVVLLASPSGKQKSRNVWKFLALASQHKHMGIAEFLHSLQSMRDLGVKNLTDAPLSSDNAVKIMTVHKSKGLEFAAVALPRLARSVYQRPEKILFAKDFAIAFDCTRDSDEQKPAFFVAANNLSRRMDEEEKKRLFYVALTRARDYLGLFISPRCKRDSNFGKWLIESLQLPEADADPEETLITVGADNERCSFKIVRGRKKTDFSREAEDSLLPDLSGGRPLLDEFEEDFDPFADLEVEIREGASSEAQTNSPESQPSFKRDFSLLRYNDESLASRKYTPVAWQQLLRACPNDPEPSVHATIAGNYFHLLMNRLGKNLELPSEKDRRSLLLNLEVAVHDPAQQEVLLKESEHLLISFKNSSLYPLMKTARRLFQESAYIIIRDGKEQELRPDLIIEDSNGAWHLVDYKTDHLDAKQVARQVSSHRAQISRYVEDLEIMLQIKAKAWIYFAQLGRLEAVDTGAPAQLSLFS